MVTKPRNKPSPKKPRKSAPRKISRKKTAAKKPVSSREMPVWLYYVLMGVMVVVFMACFYYFFIRPYSYRWKPCYGMKAYDICMPTGYRIHGIDISHHQGSINWSRLAQTRNARFPISFVFMKATEGGDFSDKQFVANFDSARVNGFIRGAYHYYKPKTDPLRQAQFFISQVKLQEGDLPPVLDIEEKGKDLNKLRADLKIWLQTIEEHYKVKPIIYAPYKFKKNYLNDSLFNSYPYWIAHYYVDSVSYKGKWNFWQHTDRGVLPGINERVDLNIFNGTTSQFDSLLIK